jgi:hypothetical protein
MQQAVSKRVVFLNKRVKMGYNRVGKRSIPNRLSTF